MRKWLDEFWFLALSIALFITASVGMLYLPMPVAQAAPVDVETCLHVATADAIKIYYCEDIGLFANQLGFMAFEP